MALDNQADRRITSNRFKNFPQCRGPNLTIGVGFTHNVLGIAFVTIHGTSGNLRIT